jgi:acyl dehydratase
MVPVGSKVRLRQKCLGVEPKAGGKQTRMEATIEVEGQERPALVAETLTVVYG